MRTDREKLLFKVQAYDFALYDAAEFLDTHQDSRAALKFYKKYQKLYSDAVAQYTSRYGALTSKTVDGENGWDWVSAPWPWKTEG